MASNKHQRIILLLLLSLAAAPILAARSSGAGAGEASFQSILKQQTTRLQVYVQDILSGPNPSNIGVASATSTSSSPTSFGLVAVLDDPVRTAPTARAPIIGRAQGIFAFAGLETTSLHMSLDLVFTAGSYNGSVLNLAGRNPYLQERRQLAVVGGSGSFLLARGYVDIRTVSMNSSTGDAFFQYNITVLNYS